MSHNVPRPCASWAAGHADDGDVRVLDVSLCVERPSTGSRRSVPTSELGQDVHWLRDLEAHDDAEEEAPESLPTTIARLWAPDCIIKQLTGPFAAYNKFADLPRAMRAAPDAKTWAAVEIWQWWAAPTHVGEDRLACYDRRVTVFAVMLSGVRAEKTATLPGLPEELWLHVFGFLKHEQQPAFA